MLSRSTHQLLLRRVVRELVFELMFSVDSSRDHTANELAGDPRGQVTLCLHMSFPTVKVWEPSLSRGNASQINPALPTVLLVMMFATAIVCKLTHQLSNSPIVSLEIGYSTTRSLPGRRKVYKVACHF